MPDYFDSIINSKVPIIMGIVNVTPDSFSDGGKFLDTDRAVKHAFNLIDDGADIIDIGGESTRPGAESVNATDEINRVVPVIEKIIENRPETIISVDTSKSEVAEKALQAGARIVNDISAATFDENILNIVKKYNAIIVLMHIKGKPKNMQDAPHYNNVVSEVKDFLYRQIKLSEIKGIKKIIVDPGIGFGKRVFENYELLKNIKTFLDLNYPVLIGLSRKSFIGKALNLEVTDRENATTVTEMFSIQNGVKIVRTHNVRNTKEIIKVLSFINNPKLLVNV
jgi:dihydropteroate synthase